MAPDVPRIPGTAAKLSSAERSKQKLNQLSALFTVRLFRDRMRDLLREMASCKCRAQIEQLRTELARITAAVQAIEQVYPHFEADPESISALPKNIEAN